MIGTSPRRPPSHSTPTEYRITCLCGRAVSGHREPESQVITCPDCQTSLFVLGQSPLPRYDAPNDSPSLSLPRAEPADPARKQRRSAARRRLVRYRRKQRLRRLLAPFRRLISLPFLVSILLVVVLGWTGQIQFRAYRDRLRAEAIEQAGRAGLQAVERGDFERADRIFEPVIADLFAEKQPTGDRLLFARAAKESQVLAHLMLDTIDRAITFIAQSPETVRSNQLGQGVLFETDVLFQENLAWADLRLFVHDRPVHVLLGTQAEVANGGITAAGRYFLGARLLSLTDQRTDWLLRVDPNSVIAVTHESVLSFLGLPQDQALLELIRQQRERVLPEDAP